MELGPLKDKAEDILKKHAKAMALELVGELIVPALEQAAKDSPTPIDDLVLAGLKDPLQKAINDLIGKI